MMFLNFLIIYIFVLFVFCLNFLMGDLVIGENIDVDENDVKDIQIEVTDKPIISKMNQFIPNPKDKCIESNLNRYCIETEDYPTEYIRFKLNKDSKKFSGFLPHNKTQETSHSSFFPSTRIPIFSSPSYYDDSQMFGYHYNRRHYQEKAIVESLCESIRTVKYLKGAKNRNDNWRYIINQDNFTQAVEIEECIDAGGSCHMTDSFPIGYSTECKQHYSLRVLIALNSDGEMIPDLFPLPSCCKCVLHRDP